MKGQAASGGSSAPPKTTKKAPPPAAAPAEEEESKPAAPKKKRVRAVCSLSVFILLCNEKQTLIYSVTVVLVWFIYFQFYCRIALSQVLCFNW